MTLTDEQIQEMVKPFIKQVHWEYEWDVVGFARAIERALLDSSHLTQPVGQTVPEGFVLAPVEPTPQMHTAFAFSYDPPQYPGGHRRLDFRSAYRAMLAAAPTVEAKP